MPVFSIITCVSDAAIYQKCLLDSVNRCRNNFDVEIIPIWNTNGLYSASLALNLGIKVARSNNLVMVHQDVRLLEDWFAIAEAAIADLSDDWGVLGSAGIVLDCARNNISRWGGSISTNTIIVGSVWHNDDIDSEPYWDGLKMPTRVHCVDECLFILNKRSGLRFDTAFNGFHFYGTDICLQARSSGCGVYAADLPIIHYGSHSSSMGNNNRYWQFLRLLHNKWKDRFPELLGTHMHWCDGELTSYIPLKLEADDGTAIYVKSLGIKSARLANDKKSA